jgi:aspartyl-tRNA(Asn)/glutamyl-tRNA(Gln) amidotransferase subunit A
MTQPANISALRDAFRKRTVSPVEVVRSALEQAESTRHSINAFTEICWERALEEAKECEAAFTREEPHGHLAGIPISVKDVLATTDIRTSMGSLDMAHHVPDADATSVDRLRKSGAIVIGKTTTPQFACKQTTNALISGTTRNPWDLELTPGGSSGGSSASLACGIGSLSLVIDGGGSARLPAACTAIVGFKPTFGFVPFDSAPDVFAGLGHIGLMARTVEDVGEALEIVAGSHPNDAARLGRHLSNNRSLRDLKGLRVGWRERLGGEPISKDILPVTQSALSTLEGMGAIVEQIIGQIEPPLPIWQTLQHAIWAERHAHRLANGSRVDPALTSGIRDGETLSARAFQSALHGRTRLFKLFQSWLERFDIVITPGSPGRRCRLTIPGTARSMSTEQRPATFAPPGLECWVCLRSRAIRL